MQRWFTGVVSAVLAIAAVSGAILAAEEVPWRTLFDGKDLSGWQNAAGNEPGKGWIVEDGAMVRAQSAGDIWTKDRFANFVLEMEFKTEGNSGIFIRTGNPRDCVQTGIEIQVDRPAREPGKHSVGAVYDALAPSKDATRPDEWNRAVITADGNRLTVEMNGEKIIDMDLEQWATAGQNPDGTRNKYAKALKDFPREGQIGFQDHGAKVSYRNVKIRVLP